MNRILPYLSALSLTLFFGAHASEKDQGFVKKSSKHLMKEAKREAHHLAKEESSQLKKGLLDERLGVSPQDFLPPEDQGKTFNAEAFNAKASAGADAEAHEVTPLLEFSRKKEVVDDDVLTASGRIIQNPESALDIKSIEHTVAAEEEALETCQEAGTYQVHFQQNLVVRATPEVKESTKHCKGHHASKTYGNADSAKKHVSSKKEKFKKDASLRSFEVHRDHTKVSWSWTHQDNTPSCDHFTLEEKIVQKGTEEERWETDRAEALEATELNPSCKLLYSTILKGPETRLIQGKPVHRNIWARQLFFSCESDAESKCAKLREQGAVLVSKKCLETNVFGECDRWEKTYDLGKKGAYQKTTAAFEKEELWGLQDEFDASYEKNTDFGSAFATLSAFSEMERSLEEQGSDWQDRLQIFKGEPLQCQKSFLEGNVFDCCKKMEGAAVTLKLASCKEEEKCLAKYRQEGKCRFVGSQKIKLGTVTEHAYCCFPSKLARIIHEQGRQQLGIKWGKAEKPKCRGLTLEELQRIDFSKIDLTEVIEDLKVDKEGLRNKLEQSVRSLQGQGEIGGKRLGLGLNPTKQMEVTNEKNKQASD